MFNMNTEESLPNFHQLGPELWRGGQPSERGFQELKKQGIRTVVCLREEPALILQEQAQLSKLNLDFVSIPLRPFSIPEDTAVERFLELSKTANHHPIFVHCLHGMDRTGLMCALYRMHVHDWTYENAYDEMIEHGFHEAFRNLSDVALRYACAWNKHKV